MQIDDREQVLKTLQGDTHAYGRLVEAYQGMVFAVALNITGNYSDSQDIVQDVFLKAYSTLRSLSKPEKFSSWLYTIAKRVSLSFLRKKKRQPVAVSGDEQLLNARSHDKLVSEAYAQKEFSALVQTEVQKLPQKLREAILLFYMEGFSVKRAAAFLDVSESAIKMRLHAARKRIRKQLSSQIEDELRSYRPSKNTCALVLAALPAGKIPKLGFFKTLTAKGGVSFMTTLTIKKTAVVALVAIAVILSVTAVNRPRKLYSEQPPVTPLNQHTRTANTAPPVTDPGDTILLIEDIIDTPAPAQTAQTSISGHVYYADTEEPVPGAYVILYKQDRYTTVITDETGYYTVPLTEGVFITEIYARKDTQASDAIRTLPTQENQNVDLFIAPGAAVSGTVLNIDTKEPLSGMKVQIARVTSFYGDFGGMQMSSATFGNDSLNNREPFHQITEGEGRFTFSGLPAGEYSCYTKGIKNEGSSVKVALGERNEGVILEIGGATVRVILSDAWGEPVDTGLIRLDMHDKERNSFKRGSIPTRNDSGHYVFENCRTSEKYEYKLVIDVIHDGYAFRKQEKFTVKHDEHERLFEFVVPDADSDASVIQGTVRDDSGNAFSACWVDLVLPDNNGSLTTNTDADGKYKFTGITPGEYTITFIAKEDSGYGFTLSKDNRVTKAVSINTDCEIETIDAVLGAKKEEQTFSIQFKFADGWPVADQFLYLNHTPLHTDEAGIAHDILVPLEEEGLHIALAGVAYCFDHAIIGQQNTITLILEKPGSLTGQVVAGKYEQPVLEYMLKAFRANNAHVAKTFTVADGAFDLDALQPGEYTLHVSAEIDSQTLSATVADVVVEPDKRTDVGRVVLTGE